MSKSIKIIALVLTIAAMGIVMAISNNADEEVEPFTIAESAVLTSPVMTKSSCQVEEPAEEIESFSAEEVTAIATTLAGECYDDKLNDKRLVTEVILNRVSDSGFGDTVIDVVSAKGQFAGYYNQSRPISDSDIQIAEETLREWYDNGCEKLSDYLFFCAGPNRENTFRTEY